MDTLDLQTVTKTLAKVASTSKVSETLQHIRVVDGIAIATGLDVWITARLTGYEADFIPSSAYKTIEKLKNPATRITVQEGKILVENGKIKGSYPMPDVNEYPIAPSFDGYDDALHIPLDALKVVAKFAGCETRAGIRNVNVTRIGELVGTDGHRLCSRDIDKSKADHDILIPICVHKIAIKVFKKGSYLALSVGYTKSDNSGDRMYCLSDGIFSLYWRDVNEQYPDWLQVLPDVQGHWHKFTATVKGMLESMDIATAVLDKRFSAIKVTVNGSVNFDTHNVDTDASMSVKVDATTCAHGESVIVGLNHLYLLDVLKTLDKHEEISVSIKDALEPIWIKSMNGYDIIMPVRF